MIKVVVLVVQLLSRHSCVADRLPMLVRFPAGPRERLKTADPPKGNRLGKKKVMIKTSKFMGPVLGLFLAPETEMIFGDGVGAFLVAVFYDLLQSSAVKGCPS